MSENRLSASKDLQLIQVSVGRLGEDSTYCLPTRSKITFPINQVLHTEQTVAFLAPNLWQSGTCLRLQLILWQEVALAQKLSKVGLAHFKYFK